MLWLISLYFSLHEWKLLRKSFICQRLCDIDSLCENLIPIIVSFVNTYLTKKNNFTAAITWEPHPPELFTWLLAPVWQKGARLHGGRPIKYLSNSLYSRFVVYFCCSYARLDHEVYQNDINNSHVQHLKTTSKKSVFFSIHSCLIRKSFNGIVSNECATRWIAAQFYDNELDSILGGYKH